MAEAKTHRSSSSRIGRVEGAAGLAATSCSRKKASISSTVRPGNWMRARKTRVASRSTTSLVTSVCSASTTLRTSAQIPRVAKALTRTLVSRNTLTIRLGPCQRPSDIRGLPQRAGSFGAAAGTSAGSTDGAGHHERDRSESGRSAGRAGRGACQGPGLVVSSSLFSCLTMYYDVAIGSRCGGQGARGR